MRYSGGKSRVKKQISGYLNESRQPGQPYWEPFVGPCWVLMGITGDDLTFASDACQPLILMWQRLQRGWRPPEQVTKTQYAAARRGEYDAATTAFVGFGCSWGGMWFAGYARGEGRNWAKESQASALKKARATQHVHFFAADFLTCYPPAQGCLIYCDPPYAGTTGYKAEGPFDHAAFWERVRWYEAHGHTCVVSEYEAPDDFGCVLEIPTRTSLTTRNEKERRTERLFRLRSSL